MFSTFGFELEVVGGLAAGPPPPPPDPPHAATARGKSASQMSSRKRNAGRLYGRAQVWCGVFQIVTGW
jgi:hypothetical protein